jgi:alpha-ketoglutarate-dependent taurine dioxygenase
MRAPRHTALTAHLVVASDHDASVETFYTRQRLDTLPELQPTHQGAAATTAVLASRESLLAALDAHDGCLLLRGTSVDSAQAMHAAFGGLMRPMDYVGGATNSRKQLAEGVVNAGTEPPHLHIPEHSEMAFLDRLPALVAFSCVQPAPSGGATTVVSSAATERNLPEAFVRKLRAVGMKHITAYGDVGGNRVQTWQAAFGTEDRADVEAYAAAQGWTCAWTEGGDVNISFTRASYMLHPRGLAGAEAEVC